MKYILLALLLLSSSAKAQFLANPVYYPTVSTAGLNSLAVSDLNNDRKPDVIIGLTYYGSVGVLLNNGIGGFSTAKLYSTGSNSIAFDADVADVNGDGILDIVSLNGTINSVSVLIGKGDGTFKSSSNSFLGTSNSVLKLEIGDVNKDGRQDVVTTNPVSGQISVLFGNGDGTFQSPITYTTGYDSLPTDIKLVDLNKDGKLDIIAISRQTILFFQGTESGNFLPFTKISAGPSIYFEQLACADINKDGNLDIITENSGIDSKKSIGVLLGNSNTTFLPNINYPIKNISRFTDITLGDTNTDGIIDVVLNDFDGKSTLILPGNGNGSFREESVFSLNERPSISTVKDINSDGREDIITSLYNGTVAVQMNTSTATTHVKTNTKNSLISVFPNPVLNNEVTITSTNIPNNAHYLKIIITDALGKIIIEKTLPASQNHFKHTLSTSNIYKGIYLLQVCTLDWQGANLAYLPTQQLCVQ